MASECRAFARHLTDAEPTEYVMRCYERLLLSAHLPEPIASALIERALLAAGRSGGLMLRIADAYACVFRPRSALRRRLILLVAILENSPSSASYMNSGDEGSFVAVGLRMIVSTATSVLCAMAGVVIFGPAHVVSAILPPARSVNGPAA